MKDRTNFKKISVYEGPKESPGFLLWYINTSWRSSIEAVLKTWGLTHPQFVILASTGWLTRNGALITQRAVGEMAHLDPNTTSQIIKGLEQKELLQRIPSSDKRAKNVSLTTKGGEILKKALPAVEKEDALFFQLLTQQENRTLVDLFQKLIREK